MEIKIKVLPVKHGDAILLKVIEEGSDVFNIFIDSGFVGTYRTVLKPEIKTIIENNEKIDYFIITHVDQDHIGGLITLLKDRAIDWVNLIGKVLFNYYDEKVYLNFSDKISYSQGVELKSLLYEKGKLEDELVYFETEKELKDRFKIKILSPRKEELNSFLKKCKKKEESGKISANKSDYDKSIEELFSNDKYEENISTENLASIAFLIEIGNFNFLFAGDASPNTIRKSLIDLGYSRENKIKIDYFKLPHHGSKNNLNLELLEIIDCQNYIVSANGYRHNNPNKSTFARILKNPERDFDKKINLIFNYKNSILTNIFNEEEKEKYNFECLFAKGGKNGYTIDLR